MSERGVVPGRSAGAGTATIEGGGRFFRGGVAGVARSYRVGVAGVARSYDSFLWRSA